MRAAVSASSSSIDQRRGQADRALAAAQQQQPAPEGLLQDPLAQLGGGLAARAVAHDLDADHEAEAAHVPHDGVAAPAARAARP